MARIVSPAAEFLLDVPQPVLDKGFVRLVDYMGGDARVVQSARVSYGEGTKTLREDAGLINYLMRNAHTSPFEQIILTFHMKLPIFIARQIVRTRTARLNEISGRYSVLKDECYLPNLERIQKQAVRNKQGSGEVFEEAAAQAIVDEMKAEQTHVFANYEAYLTDDVARELARINLPLSTYTEWYWQIDLHNLFNFLRLRLDHHAQWEVREYAKALAACARAVAPLCYEAFEDHVLKAIKLSDSEFEQLPLSVQDEILLIVAKRS
jgi:thymidylate synthase (FAD)